MRYLSSPGTSTLRNCHTVFMLHLHWRCLFCIDPPCVSWLAITHEVTRIESLRWNISLVLTDLSARYLPFSILDKVDVETQTETY